MDGEAIRYKSYPPNFIEYLLGIIKEKRIVLKRYIPKKEILTVAIN